MSGPTTSETPAGGLKPAVRSPGPAAQDEGAPEPRRTVPAEPENGLDGAPSEVLAPSEPAPAAPGRLSARRWLAELRSHLGALREPPLRRLLAAQLTSISGDYIVIAAMPFAVFAIGGSTTQVSVAFGVAGVFEFALVLFGGVLGDRFPRRSVMIAADAVRFASQGLLAALLITGEAQFWQMLVLMVFLGGGSAFFNPSMGGLIPEVVSEDALEDANALLSVVIAAGSMLGPALAGVLMAFGGPGVAFAADSLTFATSAVLLAGISASSVPEAAGSLLGSLSEGWNHFRRQSWLWIVVLEFTLLNALVFGPFTVLGAAAASETVGGASAWSVILAAVGAGRVAGGLIALVWRPQRPLFSSLGLLATWAVPLGLLALGAPLAAVAISASVAGISFGIFLAVWHWTMQNKVDPEQLSRMSSYDWLGSLGGLPIGFALAAASAALLGSEATLAISAVIVLLATLIVVPQPAIRRIRRREPRPQLALASAGGQG